MRTRRLGLLAIALALAGAAFLGAGAAVTGWSGQAWGNPLGPMMGGWTNGSPIGPGMMRGFDSSAGVPYPGMMGGWGWGLGAAGPGETGFVAGTPTAPRLVRVVAGPGYRFTPSVIRVARGETITFAVTTMGPLVHEFMVGPAADVAADREGTPEIAGIGMMQTKAMTYRFDGPGPYAFACHAPGHYEAGMAGSIEVVG